MINKEETVKRNKALCEKYPFLTWYGDPLYYGYSETTSNYERTWEDEIPAGWRKAFCPMMWDELKAILEKADFVNSFRFVQIKEKYGTLRLYSGAIPTDIADEVFAWEEKYDKLSEETCIDCGAPSTRMTLSWINFVCDDCSKKRHEYALKRFGGEDNFWTSIPRKDIDKYYKNRKEYFDTHKDSRY